MFCLFDYDYTIIRPKSTRTLFQQSVECAMRLERQCIKEKDLFDVIRVIWFYKKPDSFACTEVKKKVSQMVICKRLDFAPHSYIPQAPADGSDIQVLMIRLPRKEREVDLKMISMGSNFYTRLAYQDQKWVIIGGTGCSDEPIPASVFADTAFKKVNKILNKENLKFDHLVRQWNYIQRILDKEEKDGLVRQNYQEFNEVRADWYGKKNLTENFPAATGIGTQGGGIIIEGVAAELGSRFKKYSLRSPVQNDAHKYSESQLVGTKVESAPLFERGTMVFGEGKGHIWVSGTASIRGEDSVNGDITEQTTITCENIDQLVDIENLKSSGLAEADYEIEPAYVRAYVRNIEDGPLVQDFLDKRYSKAVIHVLRADVCREELLVEIEAEFRVAAF